MGARNELTTRGRIGRLGFWLRHLTLVPGVVFLCVASDALIGQPFDGFSSALLVVVLVSTWGRRLHDRGRSAWWLLAAALPVVGPLWLAVECGIRSSASSAQRFGAPPGTRDDYLAVPEG